MNRGSVVLDAELLEKLPAFNEAPIHESGKCADRIATLASPVPSMRPRFMNRGSDGLRADSQRAVAPLQ